MKSDSNKRAADGDVDPLDELLRSAQWPDDASDPLDQLLRMAQWPEPAVDSLPHWRQQMAGWRSRPAADPVSARPKREASPARQRQRRRMAWALVGSASVAAFFMAMTLWISGLPGDKSSASLPTKVARDLARESPAVNRDVGTSRFPSDRRDGDIPSGRSFPIPRRTVSAHVSRSQSGLGTAERRGRDRSDTCAADCRTGRQS